MPIITELEFDHEGATYRLDIAFDDDALMHEILAFDVEASRIGEDRRPITVTARVEIYPEKDEIIIYMNEREVYRFNVVNQDQSSVEQLIDSIPSAALLDPVLGCAVKAGVSAIVGQAISCARALEAEMRWRVLSEFLGCMRERFGQISKTAVYRTFRCLFTGI